MKQEFEVDDKLLLKDVYKLNLNKYQEDVEEITDQAKQEAKMEKTLMKLEETWKDVEFEFNQHKDSNVMLIRLSEENFEMLDPTCLLTVVDALAQLTDGLTFDPASGEILT